MKVILIAIIFSCPLIIKGQRPKPDPKSAITVEVGRKAPIGTVGLKYTRFVPLKDEYIEIKTGVGIRANVVMNMGTAYPFYEINSKTQLIGCLDYSYAFPGINRYIKGDKADLYKFTQCHYAHLSSGLRYKIGNFTKVQLNVGYTFLLNKVEVTHYLGTNTHAEEMNRFVKGGLMVSLDFMVLF